MPGVSSIPPGPCQNGCGDLVRQGRTGLRRLCRAVVVSAAICSRACRTVAASCSLVAAAVELARSLSQPRRVSSCC